MIHYVPMKAITLISGAACVYGFPDNSTWWLHWRCGRKLGRPVDWDALYSGDGVGCSL
jgi:hypothetical protein